MNLHELCREAGLPVSDDIADPPVFGIKTDSEKVEAGDLFLCIRGLTVDGHKYIKDAIARGAVAVAVDGQFEIGGDTTIPIIPVGDTRHAAAMLYDAWYGHPSQKLKIVAVTGTNGKTTVTHMLRAIFEAAMYKCGLIGTVSCYSAGRKLDIRSDNPLANMTTPDPEELYRMLAIMADDGVEYVFMEATSHALALRKLDAVLFEAAIFTNLTPEHLDFHGDMETYFSAKTKLFSMCKRAIINVDDAYGDRLAQTAPCSVYTCGFRGNTDFRAEQEVDLGVDGSSFVLNSRNLRFSLRVTLPGRFNVLNALEAASCASLFGVSPSVIQAAIGSLCGVNGRMERVRIGALSDFSVFIDYAHTPDALTNLLTVAAGLKKQGQRVVLVFGCGGDRDKTKRPVMGRIASELSDFCVITSDNSRSENPRDIINDIVKDMRKDCYTIVEDRAQAIEYVIQEARRGDIILLAGKGHEEYEIDRSGKHPFCEREIVRQAVLRRIGD